MWGTPFVNATGAIKVATIVGQADQFCIWAYDTGGTMENSFTAPARRIGFFLYNSLVSASLTTNGGDLFDAAVGWADPQAPPPPVTKVDGEWEIYE